MSETTFWKFMSGFFGYMFLVGFVIGAIRGRIGSDGRDLAVFLMGCALLAIRDAIPGAK